MTDENRYTPAAVSVMTGLEVRSIRRIVLRFPEAFSPDARGGPNKRGNRFTSEDVARLELCKGHSIDSSWYFMVYQKMIQQQHTSEEKKIRIETITSEVKKLRSEVEAFEVQLASKVFDHDDHEIEFQRIYKKFERFDQDLKKAQQEAKIEAARMQHEIDELKVRIRVISWDWWDLLKYTIFHK